MGPIRFSDDLQGSWIQSRLRLVPLTEANSLRVGLQKREHSFDCRMIGLRRDIARPPCLGANIRQGETFGFATVASTRPGHRPTSP